LSAIELFEFSLPLFDQLVCRSLTEEDLTDSPIFSEPLAWTKEQALASIKSGHFCFGVFRQDDLLAYFVLSELVDELELLMVTVREDLRGGGLAKAVINELFSRFDTRYESMFLEVRESNLSAIQMYKKIGFEEVGRRKNYYPALNADGQREAALVMNRNLKAKA